MTTDKLTFETKDVIKLLGFVAVISGMWYDLKGDLRVFKATTELRLDALEDNKKESKHYKSNVNYSAIMPNETKLEDE